MGDPVLKIGGDETQAINSINKVVEKMQALQKEVGKAQEANIRAAKDAQKANEESNEASFGDEAIGKIGKYAASFLSVSAAIGTVTKAFQEMAAEREKAAQSLAGSEMGMANLAQLAGGDPARLRGMMQAARKTFAEGGAGTLDEAAKIQFQLESAGLSGQRALVSQLYGVVTDPTKLVRGAGRIMTGMGAQETGTFGEVISKGFAASQFSESSVVELMEAAAKAAPSARGVKISDEELMAAVTVASNVFGPDVGGTRVSSFLSEMRKQGVTGNLKEIIAKAQGMKIESKEAFEGMDVLSRNTEMLDRITAATRGDAGGKLLEGVLTSRQVIPEIELARRARQQRAGLELEQQKLGGAEIVSQAIADEQERERIQAGQSAFRRALTRTAESAVRWIDPESFIETRGRSTTDSSRYIEKFDTMIQLLRDLQGSKTLDTSATREPGIVGEP